LDPFCILASRRVCPLRSQLRILVVFCLFRLLHSYCSFAFFLSPLLASFDTPLPTCIQNNSVSTLLKSINSQDDFGHQFISRAFLASTHTASSFIATPSSSHQTHKHTHTSHHSYIQSNHVELRFHCSCSSPAPGHGRPRYVLYTNKPVDPVKLIHRLLIINSVATTRQVRAIPRRIHLFAVE